MTEYIIPVSGLLDSAYVNDSFRFSLGDFIYESLLDKGLDEKTALEKSNRAIYSFKFFYEGDIKVSIFDDEKIDEVLNG